MKVEKSMGFLGIVGYRVTFSSPQVSARIGIPFGRVRRRSNYFFERVIKGNEDNFQTVNFRKQIDNILRESTEKLLKELRGKFGKIVQLYDVIDKFVPSVDQIFESMIVEYEVPSEYYFYKHNPSVILPIGQNSFGVLSRSKEDANKLIQHVKSEFEKLSDVTKDFGIRLKDFLAGPRFQEHILQNVKDIKSIDYKEPKNEFEKEIIDFCQKITDSYLANCEVSFMKPPESFEYDVFIGFSDDVKRIIEPTSYENIKSQLPAGENLKSQLILRTLDKAQRLEAKSIVIAKGFPEETFRDLKKIAESRGVTLLNDTDYKDQLFKVLCGDLVEAFIGPRLPFL